MGAYGDHALLSHFMLEYTSKRSTRNSPIGMYYNYVCVCVSAARLWLPAGLQCGPCHVMGSAVCQRGVLPPQHEAQTSGTPGPQAAQVSKHSAVKTEARNTSALTCGICVVY